MTPSADSPAAQELGNEKLSSSLRTIFPPFELEDHAIDDNPPIRVVVVGAGISGITAGVLLPAKVPGLELVIYERDQDVGGVWQSNIYPGVRCDVPAHAYQSTYAPIDSWTEAYASGHEIWQYWRDITKKFDVGRYIHVGHKVKSAEWSEVKGKWLIVVEANGTTFVDEANILITATGHFSDPKMPDYPGMRDFKGIICHTSAWNRELDKPHNKRVAVVGNGASGIQVLPQLQKYAKNIDHYARNKTWVAAPIGGEDLADQVAENIEKARQGPEEYLEFRKALEGRLFGSFSGIFKGGSLNNENRESITKRMTERLGGDAEKASKFIPEFPPNCRRLTPGPGYLEALTAPNVSYIQTRIEEFTATGIRTVDGTHREVDAIVCSTGHDISFSTQFPVICNGIDLQKAWRPGGQPGFPDTYLGLAAPEIPNFFTILGPNSTGPAGTLCHSVERQVTWIAMVLRKVTTQGIRTIAPTKAATRDFRAFCESFFPNTVMSEHCSSWYNGGIKGGRIHGVWPGSASHVNIVRKEPRWEDFEYTYFNPQGNRFGWLGNGWTIRDIQAAEKKSEADMTPWLEEEALSGKCDLRSYHERWWIN
ncbi:hypothetical protein NW762_006229 [Fusarium torreyae]|uniref:FAD/NAD(P)-binding domain-containing protein n=1 Tax=Fusarium torreyae TaxID=1237075 RepID=A0A9W8S179_9HYPO|nr:hypothetical protein NW762_006229 [Fusarium torreyae]